MSVLKSDPEIFLGQVFFHHLLCWVTISKDEHIIESEIRGEAFLHDSTLRVKFPDS